MAVDFETAKELARSYANDVRKVLDIDKVILYGSYATGKATKDSDIDICFFT